MIIAPICQVQTLRDFTIEAHQESHSYVACHRAQATARWGCTCRGVGLEEAIQLIKRHTRRFVRHQYTWFRLDDAAIRWFDVLGEPYGGIWELVASFLLYRRPKAR